MYEPNLQNIPKDFSVNIKNESTLISIRQAFVPKDGYILISADYCQLELRILAHLSQDMILSKALRSDSDVFCEISAQCNRIPVKEVTEEMRSQAKQLCYGIIYGMGARTLADKLEIDEVNASMFIETFKGTYPGVKKFISQTIEDCQKLGYIETLYGRRRYLDHINSSSNTLKSK